MDRAEAQLRLEALRRELHRHNRLYYVEAKPEVSDREYDRLYQELVDIESRFSDLVTLDSPSQRVGGEPLGSFVERRHAVPMLSLDNTYEDVELRRFHEYVKRGLGGAEPAYVIEPKVDGVSISLRYEEGILVQALTRGNGRVGDDVTANARTIRGVPLRLETASPPAVFEARGEVYMSRAGFAALNARREAEGEALFANARNATAGTLKQLDSRVVAQRPLEILCYAQGEVRGLELHSQAELLETLCRFGFRTQSWSPRVGGLEAMLETIRELDRIRGQFPYDIDGAVIKVDDFAQREKLGFTAKAPSWAKAFKYQPDQARTLLRAITVQVGRTGVLTPVAELEPVFLAGSTIARATLHNEDEIRRKDIRVGDTVVVQKAGEVIPEVVEVVPDLRPEGTEVFDLVRHIGGVCPSCGGPVERDPEFVAYRCPNLQCPAQSVRRLEHFATRNAMDIEALGGIVAEKLVERGLVREPLDLFDLEAESLGKLNLGTEEEPRVFGAKNAAKLREAVERARTLPLGRWLHALGIPQVGVTMARHVATCHPNLEAVAGSALLRDLVRLFDRQDALRELNPNAVRNRALSPGEKQDLQRQYRAAEAEIAELGERLAAAGLVQTSEAKGKKGDYVMTDIGPKAAESLLEFFAGPTGQAMLARLRELGISPRGEEPPAAGEGGTLLAGRTFVLTGTLETMSRDEAKERILALGGRVADAVSRNTTYLVAGANTGATKTRKAAELGVAVIDEAGLLAMLDAKPAPEPPASAIPAPNPDSSYGDLFDWASKSRK
ncbi:MAG: NAD-dependent DNA ligase LigA [Lentisphaeria bacterium]|jgi:DNA ligase (NAD+)|nr:NAD-dependent DNA ligase LigA [Lentisphaeria bacterium]